MLTSYLWNSQSSTKRCLSFFCFCNNKLLLLMSTWPFCSCPVIDKQSLWFCMTDLTALDRSDFGQVLTWWDGNLHLCKVQTLLRSNHALWQPICPHPVQESPDGHHQSYVDTNRILVALILLEEGHVIGGILLLSCCTSRLFPSECWNVVSCYKNGQNKRNKSTL